MPRLAEQTQRRQNQKIRCNGQNPACRGFYLHSMSWPLCPPELGRYRWAWTGVFNPVRVSQTIQYDANLLTSDILKRNHYRTWLVQERSRWALHGPNREDMINRKRTDTKKLDDQTQMYWRNHDQAETTRIAQENSSEKRAIQRSEKR
jgi:hypothetical protein